LRGTRSGVGNKKICMFHRTREPPRPAKNRLAHGTKKGMAQNTNVNVPAMTARATPARATRADTAPNIGESPELLPEEAAEPPVPLFAAGELGEGVARSDDSVDDDVSVLVTGVEKDTPEELEPEEGVLELELPLRYGGGGTALDGSVRAPFPQAIFSPSGWVRLGGGTVVPDALAMAKRPVQLRSGDWGEENW
jgi:hypothetical protein